MENILITRLKRETTLGIFILFLLTVVCIFGLFIWEGHLGINLSDESFLWYGAGAVSHGRVPIRDFYAYDPGRYYLTALVMKLLSNDGIIASRIAEAFVQGLGFFLALFVLMRTQHFDKKIHFIYLFFTTLTLLIWLVPLYKSFDITASIILITLLTYLIDTNTLIAYFCAGVGVGIIATIGRNHGVYGVFACICALLYLHLTERAHPVISALQCGVIGLFVGYIPIIGMLLFVPGFKDPFFKIIHDLIASKSTNLYIPIIWPWQATTLEGIVVGIFFVAILLFGICSLGYCILLEPKNKKVSSLFTACAFLSLPYAHYVFSRADVIHLALGIFPFLIGLFAYLYQVHHKFSIITLFSFVILFILSCIVVLPLHPAVQSYTDKNWQYVEITGSQLKVDINSKIKIDMFNRLINQYAQKDQSFLVVPFYFGMYSIFKRESPMWDLYPLFSRSVGDQALDITRIKKANPGFVVIYDYPLDNNEKRQFHNTHPLIFKYIVDNFELIHDSAETPNEYIFKRKL